jgi:hypothetical protein
MSDDPMIVLAMTGGSAIVAAMATAAWEATKVRVLALFRGHGRDPRATIEARLDEDAALVAEDDNPSAARDGLAAAWGVRLAALLRDHPDAEDELRLLVPKKRDGSAYQTDVHAGGNSTVQFVVHGNFFTDFHGTRPSAPHPPAGATGGDDAP